MGSQDCCFVDVGVVVPELSPVVSARVPAIAEVFSSAVFDGGGGLMQPPLANVGTVTVGVSVLMDAGAAAV